MDTIKVKQEKVTPPASPTRKSPTSLNITDDLLDNILGERKPVAEPVKSSNELLADLFKVFNAAPPTLDEENDSKDSARKKKKHKKEKKAKKHKKHSHDGKSSDEEKSKLRKVKKAKKRESDDAGKKRRTLDLLKDMLIKSEPNDVVVKKEKIDESEANKSDKKKSKTSDDTKSRPRTDDKNPPLNIQVSVTKDCDGSGGKRKIVIKSLVNSIKSIQEAADAEQREKQKEQEKLKERERAKDRERRKQHSHSSKLKEKDRKRRSRSSSLSLSDEETYLRERERYRGRDRERDKDREKEKEKDDFYGDYRRDLDKDLERRHNRSRNDFYRSEHDRRRSRSTSRHRRERAGDHRSSDRIDKKRLLQIARKNAISMLKNGTLPGTHNLDAEAKERALTKMRYGGKTVDELTEYCKKLSKGEANGYLSNLSGESDIDADLEKPFHHPFAIKDRGPIVMNIKNSIPIPPKTADQTKAILMQFPVSSGQHHRLNESEWVPVVPAKPPKKDKEVTAEQPKADSSKDKASAAQPVINDEIPLPTTDYGYQTTPAVFAPPIEPAPVFPAAMIVEPVPAPVEPIVDNIFADKIVGKDLDVTSIISKRLNAMRKLQDNPLDSEAIKLMYKTQKDMSAWADSKFVPGQFTGSTGASILSTKELASGFQAWAKRDQLIATTPVSGGMGMHLLQKMGWKPGEGLGKEKNGSLQPLLLEVKLDKKGLVAEEENPQVQRQRAQAAKKVKATSLQMAKQQFESKHPVSLLGELSAKRKFGAPMYDLVMQEGPSHQRQFLYSVTINNQIYQPCQTSLNKKEAKASAAKFALQKMGFLPDVPMSVPVPVPQPPQPVQAPNQNYVNPFSAPPTFS